MAAQQANDIACSEELVEGALFSPNPVKNSRNSEFLELNGIILLFPHIVNFT